MKHELTASERKELEALYIALSQRARTINSIVATSEFSMMYYEGRLSDLRFFAKHWGASITMDTVRAANNASKLLNQEPVEFITENHLKAIQTFTQCVRDGGLAFVHSSVVAKAAAVIIQNIENLDFIISLVVDRKITDPDEISRILNASEDSPRPLTGGVL